MFCDGLGSHGVSANVGVCELGPDWSSSWRCPSEPQWALGTGQKHAPPIAVLMRRMYGSVLLLKTSRVDAVQ